MSSVQHLAVSPQTIRNLVAAGFEISFPGQERREVKSSPAVRRAAKRFKALGSEPPYGSLSRIAREEGVHVATLHNYLGGK